MAHKLSLSFSSESGDHTHIMWLDATPHILHLPEFDEGHLLKLSASSFNHKLASLKFGRFFPSQLLSVSQSLPAEMFRVVELNQDYFTADFNHPLSNFNPTISHDEFSSLKSINHLPEKILSWAAMETPQKNGRTDFTDNSAFMRDDPANDAEFYATPRKLIHTDGGCASRIATFYAEILEPGSNVLDLMSGWRSHLPNHLGNVIGLGMNEAEMADNPQLDSYLIHDLNQNTTLPFKNNEFDYAVNTVSIEYLIRPVEVLKEVLRVLKPGGKFAITFSNRYFPPKAIYLWKNIHPVERLGWVLQSLEEAGFVNMKSCVERGLARDPSDRYAMQMKEMDPLFAISAQAPD